jgi:hypothetical protein
MAENIYIKEPSYFDINEDSKKDQLSGIHSKLSLKLKECTEKYNYNQFIKDKLSDYNKHLVNAILHLENDFLFYDELSNTTDFIHSLNYELRAIKKEQGISIINYVEYNMSWIEYYIRKNRINLNKLMEQAKYDIELEIEKWRDIWIGYFSENIPVYNYRHQYIQQCSYICFETSEAIVYLKKAIEKIRVEAPSRIKSSAFINLEKLLREMESTVTENRKNVENENAALTKTDIDKKKTKVNNKLFTPTEKFTEEVMQHLYNKLKSPDINDFNPLQCTFEEFKSMWEGKIAINWYDSAPQLLMLIMNLDRNGLITIEKVGKYITIASTTESGNQFLGYDEKLKIFNNFKGIRNKLSRMKKETNDFKNKDTKKKYINSIFKNLIGGTYVSPKPYDY